MTFGSISRSSARFQSRHLDALDLGAGGLEHEPLGDGLPAVDLFEERGERRRDHVDHVPPQRLAGAVVRGVAHHRLGRLGVAPVLAGELGDVRRGVVDHLLAQVLAELLAGRRRSAWTSRCWSAAPSRARRPPARSRHPRSPRSSRPARRRRRPAPPPRASTSRSRASRSPAHRACRARSRPPRSRPPRRAQLVLDVALRDRVDVVVELDDEHARSLVGCRGGQCEEDGGDHCRKEAAERSRAGRVHASNVPVSVFRAVPHTPPSQVRTYGAGGANRV